MDSWWAAVYAAANPTTDHACILPKESAKRGKVEERPPALLPRFSRRCPSPTGACSCNASDRSFY
jgi:hypothetical protein